MTGPIHHVELWTHDLAQAEPSFHWLFTELGWTLRDDGWDRGRVWTHPAGVYVVLEQSPDVRGHHDRHRAGLNHLALTVPDRPRLDALRAACGGHGWTELFADAYPHAGGPAHTALFAENAQGFEVEIVAPGP
ncbi:VOC family protein [Pseudonocardia spirodelae]|uniref:VOC family protein n=1 Tax=Pseudonocardia spirodelae TaxID=3133431 RepID=A0ABU8TA24_9PSEU